MFQLFSYIMHLVPFETQLLYKKDFPQPMFAHDVFGRLHSLICEENSMVRLDHKVF